MLKKTMMLLSLIWLCGCTRYERIEVQETRGEQMEKATEEMNEDWKNGAEIGTGDHYDHTERGRENGADSDPGQGRLSLSLCCRE